MQTSILLIGQGISGTWLSYYLERAGIDFFVIDDDYENAPSKRAAGLINPVTGRRHVKVWLAEEILPFTLNAYREIGNLLGVSALTEKTIIDFFPSPQMRISFAERVAEKADFVSMYEKPGEYTPYFNYEFGYGQISPAYTAQLENVLPAWRQHLLQQNKVAEEKFDLQHLQIQAEGILYRNIRAKKIIFCDGNSCASNPFFKNLPFVPNKGEAITLNIPNLPSDKIYKKGMTLAPLSPPGQWWIGSTYQWEFENEKPTAEFKIKVEQLLNQWLKMPYIITGHYAAVRPATLQRRPFVGFHPQHPVVGVFNGMGTKGCSLAPYFAKQLVDCILYNNPIHPEASIERYARILSK
jgi:glycine/D-amino acid oxidase-like deaminating enzyme